MRELVASNAEEYIGWLSEACSFPSLAGERAGLESMRGWLEGKFSELGGVSERLAYESAPEALLARFGEGRPAVLVYDHYDVQPVDPVELWSSKPFSPVVRDGFLVARGAADNKGDLVARLAAVDVYRRAFGELPFELKFLVEGEEETGSKSFEALVNRHADKLGAEGCMWEGARIDHAGRPEVVFGAKGLAYVELVSRGLKDDQHSALAVIAPSPTWRLLDALSTLRSPEGEVLIEGFYADVVAPTEEDESLLAAYPIDEEAEKERLGVDRFVADARGPDLVRRYFFEPTCNLAGIVAGHTVPGGSKTVLPKEAIAKVDMRLVPEQIPHDIVAKLRRHLDALGYADIELIAHSMQRPVRSPGDSLVGRAAIAACHGIFDHPPLVAPMMIGTGPMYPIAHTLGIPTASPAGVSRPDSNIHAADENCRIDDFLRVIEYSVAWLRAAGGAGPN